MPFAVPVWLDSFLIAPFTWLPYPALAFWLGCFVLAAYAVLLGEVVSGLLFLSNKKYYISMQDEMARLHNLSVQALQSGDKESYMNINSLAHEAFGKTFFAEASVGMSSIVPVPFALAWLAVRFTGIPIVPLPFTEHTLGYPFVFLLLYIVQRIAFAQVKHYVPFFRRIHEIKKGAKEARGKLRSFFSAPRAELEEQPVEPEQQFVKSEAQLAEYDASSAEHSAQKEVPKP